MPGEGYLELEWSPGVMQVDFGLAQAAVAGNRTDAHCLVVSFPHSNMRYAVALPGENAECVRRGAARGVRAYRGRAAGHGVRTTPPARDTGSRGTGSPWWTCPRRFFEHYRIEAGFCNPASGWEKGSVENAVGFLRRNVMVPLPDAESYAQLTRFMLSRCDEIAERPHYRLKTPVGDLSARRARVDATPAVPSVRRVPVGDTQGR